MYKKDSPRQLYGWKALGGLVLTRVCVCATQQCYMIDNRYIESNTRGIYNTASAILTSAVTYIAWYTALYMLTTCCVWYTLYMDLLTLERPPCVLWWDTYE